MDSLVTQIHQINELGKVNPQERVFERVVEHIVNFQVPQIIGETMEVIQWLKETTESVKIMPQERV